MVWILILYLASEIESRSGERKQAKRWTCRTASGLEFKFKALMILNSGLAIYGLIYNRFSCMGVSAVSRTFFLFLNFQM